MSDYTDNDRALADYAQRLEAERMEAAREAQPPILVDFGQALAIANADAAEQMRLRTPSDADADDTQPDLEFKPCARPGCLLCSGQPLVFRVQQPIKASRVIDLMQRGTGISGDMGLKEYLKMASMIFEPSMPRAFWTDLVDTHMWVAGFIVNNVNAILSQPMGIDIDARKNDLSGKLTDKSDGHAYLSLDGHCDS